jgi:hypothetical protein
MPGELFGVDDHQMHLYCSGQGSPTVVLDAGLGDSALNLLPLQQASPSSRGMCGYDRPDYGWSEPGPDPRATEQIVNEFAALLDAFGESGPFVLAGDSLRRPQRDSLRR